MYAESVRPPRLSQHRITMWTVSWPIKCPKIPARKMGCRMAFCFSFTAIKYHKKIAHSTFYKQDKLARLNHGKKWMRSINSVSFRSKVALTTNVIRWHCVAHIQALDAAVFVNVINSSYFIHWLEHQPKVRSLQRRTSPTSSNAKSLCNWKCYF